MRYCTYMKLKHDEHFGAIKELTKEYRWYYYIGGIGNDINFREKETGLIFSSKDLYLYEEI